MTAEELQDLLHEVLEALIDARGDDDDPLADLAATCELSRIRTYAEAGILTIDAGLVLACEDGGEFQLTLVRSALGEVRA